MPQESAQISVSRTLSLTLGPKQLDPDQCCNKPNALLKFAIAVPTFILLLLFLDDLADDVCFNAVSCVGTTPHFTAPNQTLIPAESFHVFAITRGSKSAAPRARLQLRPGSLAPTRSVTN